MDDSRALDALLPGLRLDDRSPRALSDDVRSDTAQLLNARFKKNAWLTERLLRIGGRAKKIHCHRQGAKVAVHDDETLRILTISEGTQVVAACVMQHMRWHRQMDDQRFSEALLLAVPYAQENRGLGLQKRLTARAGMHGDQLRTQSCCPTTGSSHGCRNVVELEIQKHPQALVAQLGDHSRPCLNKQFQLVVRDSHVL